ncbi:MotA/TolQ/ExbB proton channel family protein [Pseudoalteromonas luteoviolacea]|uniref:MotA/TolQ/ExbB proton channel family protein n=1 Tax=Pseudoalteromonas luteoviolacea TaxID=43657 RepID=UPI001F24F7E4|nr:MotA/TolQ/ExbB proton channel family protein [Pseudoalteromonas luteoviolacea]MCF6439356.1 MotA/TolQ/ExbB proton channel family protein [Pseudoalteromonas luteoviolacea]
MIKHICQILLCVICFPLLALESNHADQLIGRIATAKQQLLATQARIDQEHKQLAKQLNAQLAKLRKLRNEAKNIRRLEDEQLLNINQLEKRNQQWQNQHSYQSQLISAFEKNTQSRISNADGSINIEQIITALNKKLTPAFEQKNLIGSDNKLNTFDVIKIGPIEYAINDIEAGVVSFNINNTTPLLKQISQQDILFDDLNALKKNGNGLIHFDPTLGNADKLNQSQFSLIEYLQQGGTWAIPIVSFALAALIIGLLKAIQLSKLPSINPVTSQIIKYSNIPMSQAELKTIYGSLASNERVLFDIVQHNAISQKRDDLLLAELAKQKAHNEKYIGVITTCATVSPLLGLLGTVSGMIHTFMMMNIFGSGDASVVSGGISQALITTELGLIVAIPALIVSALLTKRVKNFQSSIESLALHLSKLEINQSEQAYG